MREVRARDVVQGKVDVRSGSVVEEKRVRLYDNPVLEWLSRVHPAVPIGLWGPVSLGLIYVGYRMGISPVASLGITLGGIVTWTFAEYVLHRWIFHWEPKNQKLREFYYPMHRLHHDVQEWDRLVTPPLMAVPFWLAFFGLFYLALGTPLLFPFAGGFTIGYLGYDYVHYMTHFGKPKSKLARTLRKRHLQHHFGDEEVWFGVSSQLWDFVFGTMGRR